MDMRSRMLRGLLLIAATGLTDCRSDPEPGQLGTTSRGANIGALTPASATACGVCVAGDLRPCIESKCNCALGKQLCGADLQWGECSILPLPSDTCSAGDDANCNGIPNEGCPCAEGEV